MQERIERTLAPYAHLIDTFSLKAPQDEDAIYLAVDWYDKGRPGAAVPFHDEAAPDFETEMLKLLNP